MSLKTTSTLALTSGNLVERPHFYTEAFRPSKNTLKNLFQFTKIRYDISKFQISRLAFQLAGSYFREEIYKFTLRGKFKNSKIFKLLKTNCKIEFSMVENLK